MDKKSKRESLFDIAGKQGGFFSAQQAVRAGYSYRLQTHNVKSGHWTRMGRGIFRMNQYPQAEREDLIFWSLWSRNIKGEPVAVVSHESALVVHDLSDAMPARIHLTVPRGFQKKAPKGVILHHKELPGTETEERIGYRVTTPRQTLCDVADGGPNRRVAQ